MKRVGFTLVLALLIISRMWAQSTTVSGQVTDAGSQSWNNGTFNFTFVPNPNQPAAVYTWTGGTLPTNISGTLTSSGSYSVSIPSNAAISPIGTSWSATFCPQATWQCYSTQNIVVQGATQTFNVTPGAIQINLVNPPSSIMRAYSDSEIAAAVIASMYYNLPAQLFHVCQAVTGQLCTTWGVVGTGGTSTWATLTGGTNNSSSFVCGTGCSITPSGTGIITATNGGGGGGINPPAGDIGGTTGSPTVVSTHLASPLPVNQGGTGLTAPALVAGTNVTITGSWPDQTINAASSTQVYPGAGVANSTGGAWGTSYQVGTSPGNIPILNGSGQLTVPTTSTAGNLSGTPALNNGITATTQAASDNSTLLATDAFVQSNQNVAACSLYGSAYYGTATTLTCAASPAGPGNFEAVYAPTNATPVAPAIFQVGLPARGIGGATSSDTVSYADNLFIVEHDVNASVCLSQSLPLPTTLNNSEFGYSYANHNQTCIDTITPVSPYTINGGPNIPINPNEFCRFYVDPLNPTANWLSDCSNLAAGSSAPFSILTDATTINWAVTGQQSNAKVTLGGNRSLSITGATSGWQGSLFVIQDGTGSRTLGLSSGNYVEGGGAGVITPALSTVAGSIDHLYVTYDGTNFYWDATHKNYTAAAGGATFTFVEAVANTNAGCASALTKAYGTNTTSGEAEYIYYSVSNPTGTVTPTDSASNVFTKAWERTSVGGHDTTGLAYFFNTGSGVSSVSLTATGSNACRLVAMHFKRSTGSWAVDQLKGASSTGVATPWSSPTVTTTVANELLLGGAEAFRSTGTCAMAASGSWTGQNSDSSGVSSSTDSILMYQTVTSIQTNIAATGTTSGCTTFGGSGNYPGIMTVK